MAAGLVLAGCAVNPVTGRSELALMQVSTDQEIEIGRKTFPEAVQQMGGEYRDPALNNYVRQVGQKIARTTQRPDLPFEFKVLNDSTPNAFALPGGFIGITRGLLTDMENEAQLASVLGHELGHVTARHSVQGMQRGTLLNLGMVVLSGVTGESAYGALAQKTGQVAAQLLDNTYSREQERESDRLGVDYMVLAGYDPQGAVQLQEYFYRQVERGAEPALITGLFRTHPFSKERMIDLQSYIAGKYPQIAGNPRYVMNPQPFQRAVAGLLGAKKGFELHDQAAKLEEQGQLSQAIALYLQAAAAAPNQSLILADLGMAYARAGDLESGRRHLAQAVKLDDGYFRSRLGLGYVLLEKNLPADASKHLEASMKLLPTLQGGYLLGRSYESTGRKKEAAELYLAVSKADAGGRLGKAAAERLRIMEGR
ncbi:MAG: M48 family metalloprotease [Syntrophotaleaceae bacterium]